MSARIFRVRLPAPLDAQLVELCDLMQQSFSGAIRACVEHVLSDPELWAVVLARHASVVFVDPRTPEQAANWEANKERLMHMDLTPLIRTYDPASVTPT